MDMQGYAHDLTTSVGGISCPGTGNATEQREPMKLVLFLPLPPCSLLFVEATLGLILEAANSSRG